MKNMRRVFSSFMLVAFILIIPVYAVEDKHFIQSDDYFIAEDELGTKEWMYVSIAKMKTPAKPETKNEAEFMKVTDGNDVWTQYYWQTRIATPDDFKLGTVVIIFEQGGDNEIYRAPKTKEEARQVNWFMAKITDVSDLYKKYVTVSGGYKTSIDNMRVKVSTEAPKPKVRK